jgi:hypothetical protein
LFEEVVMSRTLEELLADYGVNPNTIPLRGETTPLVVALRAHGSDETQALVEWLHDQVTMHMGASQVYEGIARERHLQRAKAYEKAIGWISDPERGR